MTMISRFADMTSSQFVCFVLFCLFVCFIYVALFLLSSLVAGISFMSISLMVLELWQFSFIKDWPEIQKSEIPPSEFCLISGDSSKFGIANLAPMILIKCYWMLQNDCFSVIKGKSTKGRVKISPIQIRVNHLCI